MFADKDGFYKSRCKPSQLAGAVGIEMQRRALQYGARGHAQAPSCMDALECNSHKITAAASPCVHHDAWDRLLPPLLI